MRPRKSKSPPTPTPAIATPRPMSETRALVLSALTSPEGHVVGDAPHSELRVDFLLSARMPKTVVTTRPAPPAANAT